MHRGPLSLANASGAFFLEPTRASRLPLTWFILFFFSFVFLTPLLLQTHRGPLLLANASGGSPFFRFHARVAPATWFIFMTPFCLTSAVLLFSSSLVPTDFPQQVHCYGSAGPSVILCVSGTKSTVGVTPGLVSGVESRNLGSR